MSRDDYTELVAQRKKCRACVGLTNPSQVDGGRFDSDQIGPWSRWQGNLSADLMIVGQDWGDTRYFRTNRGWDEQCNATNQTLTKLLNHIGIVINAQASGSQVDGVFLTNAVLCLKEGGNQSKLDPKWIENCSSFLSQQVDIITPKVLVALGEVAMISVRKTFGLRPMKFSVAVSDAEGDIVQLRAGRSTRLFAVYHCGRRILNTHRPYDAQLKDWERIGRFLRNQ